MTRTSQKSRINKIHEQLKLMSSLVEKQIYNSMKVLQDNDINACDEVLKKDDIVDDYQKEIEEACIIYIATEQPLAKDLRRIFAVTKIVTELERMGDHAVDICKIIKKIDLNKYSFTEEAKALWEMEEGVRNMINLSIESFIARDVDKAYEICKMDDDIDVLYKKVFKFMLKESKSDESEDQTAAQLLFVGKHLERIGDRVTNICEGTIYATKGIYVDLNE